MRIKDIDVAPEVRRPDRIPLRSGRCVILQPLEPSAAPQFRRFLRELSPASRTMRFHAAMADVTEPMLHALTAADQQHHVAWVAAECSRPGSIVAEARYVAADGEAGVAVAVADDFQRQGLGRALLGRLLRHAAAAGVRRAFGHVRADNAPMLRLAAGAGLAVRPMADDQSGVVVERKLQRDDEPVAVGRRVVPATSPSDLPTPAADQTSSVAALRKFLAVGLPVIAALLLPGGIVIAALAAALRHWQGRARHRLAGAEPSPSMPSSPFAQCRPSCPATASDAGARRPG